MSCRKVFCYFMDSFLRAPSSVTHITGASTDATMFSVSVRNLVWSFPIPTLFHQCPRNLCIECVTALVCTQTHGQYCSIVHSLTHFSHIGLPSESILFPLPLLKVMPSKIGLGTTLFIPREIAVQQLQYKVGRVQIKKSACNM